MVTLAVMRPLKQSQWKRNTALDNAIPVFDGETKIEAVRILVFFQDRPTF